MSRRIDEPCPICGGPCSTWAISDDPSEDMVLCWTGDYKVRGLENHRRLSGTLGAAKAMAAFTEEQMDDPDAFRAYMEACNAVVQAVRGGR